MPYHKTIFGGVEGMVGDVLDPNRRVGLGEHAEADLEHVHVEEGDLRPVGESGFQAEGCVAV